MRARAFTLVEVVVALTLLVLLAGGTSAFLRDLQRSRRVLLDLHGDLQAGSAVIELLERDLATCIAGNASAGPGISGREHSITVLSRGITPSLTDADDAMRDLQSSVVAWDERTGQVAVTRFTPGASGSATEVVSARVERLRLRYHDGVEWRDSFDSTRSKRLPVAVEVAVWFAPAGGAPRLAPATDPLAAESAEGSGELALPLSRDELDASFAEVQGGVSAGAGAERVWGEPDRLRVIAIPDAVADQGRGRAQ